jgi:hypothetical protein
LPCGWDENYIKAPGLNCSLGIRRLFFPGKTGKLETVPTEFQSLFDAVKKIPRIPCLWKG